MAEEICCPKCGAPWKSASPTLVDSPLQPTCYCGECSDQDLGGRSVTNYPPEPVTREEYEKRQREA